MFAWFVKKVVCGKVNDLLAQYKDDVENVKSTLNVWIVRIKAILQCLENMLKKLDDNELSPDDVKDINEEIKTLIKEW